MLLSKVNSNRLKKVLSFVISESQSAFVPGRLVTNNVLLAYEQFHYLCKKTKGAKGFMKLKLDMNKAYDQVEWTFVKGIMEKLGFADIFVELVMHCITLVTYSLLFNGLPTSKFTPRRPYIPFFVPYMRRGALLPTRGYRVTQLDP